MTTQFQSVPRLERANRRLMHAADDEIGQRDALKLCRLLEEFLLFRRDARFESLVRGRRTSC